MSKKAVLLFIFLILISVKNFATHIVGGEMYYDYLGGNNYNITLKVYRDCYNGDPPLDSVAYIFIFDNSGNFIDSLAIPLPGSTLIPPAINHPCFTAPTDVCVEEGVYQAIVNLPPIAGGYHLSYQRCCRNNSIMNLIDPGNTGTTYTAYIPDVNIYGPNSNPRYNDFPPVFICAGVPLDFNHSANDPDGDSLYYEFCDPYHGASASCPQFGPPATMFGCPEVGSPPPFPFVNWETGYNASYPMSSSPAMAVNPVSGLMTGTPNTLGQWVIAVCVSEYRNGVLLSVNKRDFQFNVVDCPGLPVASIPLQSSFCTGYTVNFSQNSVNANSYSWNFGDPTTISDVSSAFAPSWTYADSGVYTVTLIINPGMLCADTNTVTYRIYPILNPSFVSPPAECLEGNSFNFACGGTFMGNGTYSWGFGSNASPSSSSLQNPNNIVFNSAGTFPVTLTVNENGCSDTFTGNVQVNPSPVANFGLSSEVSCILNPVQFNDSSISSTLLSYQWNFDNGFTSTLQNPTTTYNSVGVYDVTLIVTSQNGCKDTVELPAPLNVLPPPVASFSHSTNCFNNTIDFIQNSTGGSTYSWTFGDPSSSIDISSLEEPSWTYPDSGSYTVTLTVNPGTSCMATISNSFSLNLPLIPTLTAPAGECIYSNSFDLSPAGSYMGNGSFSWNFGSHADPSTSLNENNTNIVFDTTGTFPVTLSITENGCTANLNTTITVYPKPEAFFEITTSTGCALNPVHFIDDSQSDTPLTYLWDFGDGSSSIVQDPYVTYADSGHYTISLEITTTHGCKDTFEYASPLVIFPSPVAGFHIDPTYTSIFAPDVTMTDLSTGASWCEANWGDGFITSICTMTHPYTVAGTYQLMQQVVNTYGCYDTAYAQVIIDDNYLFWLPNAFTPGNLDGTNDDFKPKAIGIYDYTFMIFNRWGEKLFETTELEEGWNGIYKGNLCSNDVYVYKINFRDKKLNNQHEYIGRVTLVR